MALIYRCDNCGAEEGAVVQTVTSESLKISPPAQWSGNMKRCWECQCAVARAKDEAEKQALARRRAEKETR